jgi:DNA repair protein RecN (Recombination protein N)
VLTRLSIANLATIESLELELGRGFTVFTGETGAGKSILIDAIRFALGARGSLDLMRTGAQQTLVETTFALAGREELRERLEALGLPETVELVIRRVLQDSGRSRTVVNDCTVSQAALESMAVYLVSIHGQHDNQMLLQPSAHIHFLDRFGALLPLREEVSALHARHGALAREQRLLTEERQRREQRRAELAALIEELQAAGLGPGEDEALLREHALLTHAERLIQLSEAAAEALYEGQGAAHALLARAAQALSEAARIDPALEPLAGQLAPLRFHVEDLHRAISAYRARLEPDPDRLEWINARLALLEKLKRRHGGTLAAVLETLASAEGEWRTLEQAEQTGETLERELGEVAGRLHRTAQQLTSARKAAAKGLERAVREQLAQLGMEKARFETRIGPARSAGGKAPAYGPLGGDEVEFQLSTNPGQAPRPLSRIASGGELSRIMLALKSVLAKADLTATLIFDEVDSGISGAMAEVVGRKLRALGESHQVLCVTHLPQIAALASHHVRVLKEIERGQTYTRVEMLHGEAKVREVARLLSGLDVSDHSVRSAEEMVQRGQRPPL